MRRTWTGSTEPIDQMDDTSRKILAANSRTFGPEGSMTDQTGISIFDPVLTELMYKWFCPIGGSIIDPFAGGSVRGVVASKLGFNYCGFDLSKRQIEANIEQGKRLCENQPTWINADSEDIPKHIKKQEFDMLFTCPPYAFLEVYSDDPKDLSTMDYKDFLSSYESIINKACATLKDNTFAVIVVGEVRDKKTGCYVGFVPDTIRAFEKAGLKYYNEMILVTAIGSLPLRAGRAFSASRKIGKTHQNVLVFVKGDAKKASSGLTDSGLAEATVGAGE